MVIAVLHGTPLSAVTQPQSGNLTITPHASTVVGDLILVVCSVADTASANYTISGGTGTWTTVLASASLGTGKFFVFSKTFASGDTTYTLARTGSDAYRIIPETIQGWDPAVTPVVGTLGTRAASGGTNTTTAPSINTTVNDSVVFYLATERTPANDNAPTINNGFSTLYDAHTLAGDNLQALYLATKTVPTAGAVGATTATFTNKHATNSGAFLYALGQKADTGGGTAATVVGSATNKNTGGTSVTFGLPSGVAAGDLILVEYLAGAPTAATTDHASKGWWDYGRTAVNSRSWGVYARIYDPATPTGDYTLTMAASAYARWASVAVRGHGVSTSTDIQVGTSWLRGSNGGSQGPVIAPSITTPGPNRLALAFFGEASNATGTYSITNANGFSLVVDGTEDVTSIEWVNAWQKTLASSGATGNVELNWSATPSLNGIGMQVSIPPAAAGPGPATGRIAGHAITYCGETVLNVGAVKLGGTTIAAVLYNSAGTTEVQRKTLTADGTTGWGNAQFTGLAADTVYSVKFEVDSTTQTDAVIVRAKTKKVAGTPVSFVAVGGSCQFTGSNHPIFRAIAAKNPEFFTHMGDLHYADPTTDSAWRTAVNSSLSATNFKYLLDRVPFNWTWDNHDRIILDAGSSASPLNMGYTDPATNTQWRTFSGSAGDYLSSNSAGRMWRVGRVMFIQTDQWTNKDDPDAVAEPRTFLGATQKQAFKDALQLANDTPGIALVVWWCSWTTLNNANGRWNSFPSETAELEAFIDARPTLKKKMVLIGGDSHSLQADSGTRTGSNFRFKGIPNLNVSGFNRDSTTGDGNTGWDIANGPLITPGTPEQGWGGYSLLNITDNGKELRFRWEAKRVHDDGSNNYTEDTIAYFERSYGTDIANAYVGTTPVKFVSMGNVRLWGREDKGSDYTPSSTA